ncbi:hypothetical protein PLICRDRAFT_129839 [Plicaturopsis crispa FD-325 SS-3]|nr:hypothetical protein PLICRDRAFT_129839 [Plicaturopsis crispa FD-325 SS-3]
MDTDLRCNRLTCRRALSDKAVVTTCSHLFCVDCANELFNAARLCPACETSLSEPDDVVVCSLRPSNDYKTSVLSGLSPSIILEICGRAIAFWQYQIHQENSFQQAVVRNLNDKSAQAQKQLDNVVREANGEIGLLGNKVSELERDLEVERRKVRDLQDASRERDKEYTRLKTQFDRIKRKALLAPSTSGQQNDASLAFGANLNQQQQQNQEEPQQHAARTSMNFGKNLSNAGSTVDLGAVVGGMEANGIQRTPIVNRTSGSFMPQQQQQQQPWPQQQQGHMRAKSQRQPFGVPADQRSYRTSNASDRSDSANEVENLLLNPSRAPVRTSINGQSGWPAAGRTRSTQRAFPPPAPTRLTSGFRPTGAGVLR